jgi:hypothetical protein
VTPEFETNIDDCTLVEQKEQFTSQFMHSEYTSRPFKFANNTDLTPHFFLGAAVLIVLSVAFLKK